MGSDRFSFWSLHNFYFYDRGQFSLESLLCQINNLFIARSQ